MSADNCEAGTTYSCCASCGIAEGDGVKLKNCTACYLVRYCGVECQKEHRPKHKRACKKRAAELRDELLFKQPESSHHGDCPICCLPLSLDMEKSTMMWCCSKVICNGCHYANLKREIEANQERKCPFCRHPLPKSQAEGDKQRMKRIEANDPAAIREVGLMRNKEGNCKNAFEYWTKAAELGDVVSHYQLSRSYRDGEGVEKDKKKEVHHAEQAAICGHPEARNDLGIIEYKNGRHERAVKHWMIAAKLGLDESLANLKQYIEHGMVSKEDFAATLRAHQAAVHATKSPHRAVAESTLRR